MTIIAGVASILVLLIIYLYVRTEGLRRELASTKRQLGIASNELKHMELASEHLAFEQQAALRQNMARVKSLGHPDGKIVKYTEAMIDALVNVTVEAARGHKNVIEAFKKQLGRHTDISHEDFDKFISEQEDRIKMEWHKKTVLGYLTVCRLMIDVASGVKTEEAS